MDNATLSPLPALPVHSAGLRGVWRLGLAGLTRRPGGSLLQIAGFSVGVLALLLLSLAGLPATAGFMAKFAIFDAALQSGYVGLVLMGVLSSVISFAFYPNIHCDS